MAFDEDLPERPLGPALRSSGQQLSEQSAASFDAAENLLTKALDRLGKGQDEAALKLVERAVGLPYDEFERIHPALNWLELEIHSRLETQVEASRKDDLTWVEQVEVLVAGTSGTPQIMLRAGLYALLLDFGFPPAQERRLQALIGDESQLAPLIAGRKPQDELVETTLQSLRLLARHQELQQQ
ncbi:hypothetical protein [Kineosporia babensis]|uniref:Uncharacterized protein n=1 Tax=Kineosporia babensis TaxID=499548 RepID=A0A9X1N9Q5_9ACTN|nr:hypothetical protein [Kineosporia babensis]MCD5311162.1 hypothetical protein [Kineosporia babensis]